MLRWVIDWMMSIILGAESVVLEIRQPVQSLRPDALPVWFSHRRFISNLDRNDQIHTILLRPWSRLIDYLMAKKGDVLVLLSTNPAFFHYRLTNDSTS